MNAFIEDFNNRLKMVELTSKPIIENDHAWQQHGTPDEVINMMLDMYYENGFKNNERILILFNVEFIKQIYFKYKDELIFGNIYFIADSKEKFEIVSKLYPTVHSLLYMDHNVEKLVEKIGEFNVKKFDIVFSNPPYNDGLDLKILSSIKNQFKFGVIVHPATWILENKNLGKFKTFKNEWKNNIEKIVIFSGSKMFNLGFMCPLDICIFNTEKNECNFNVEDQVIKSKYNVKDINDVTIYGDIWFKFNIKNFVEKIKSYKSILEMPNRQKHFNNESYLKYPCKLPVLRSGSPHFIDGIYNEELKYYVLNKSNAFFTCIAKGDPNKYHFVFKEKNSSLCYNFQTENERSNFYNYCKTKIFRFILSIRKVSGNVDRGELAWTPWLDFTQEWNDAKLCKEFEISEEFWKYIDNFIPDYYDDYKSGFKK